jgi:hypothetical protein
MRLCSFYPCFAQMGLIGRILADSKKSKSNKKIFFFIELFTVGNFGLLFPW